MYFEGELPVVATSGNCNNGMFGNNGDWIWAFLLLALLGNGGWGFGGGNGGDFAGWQLGRLATTNDVASGFSTSEIMSDLNDIILGQAQMQNFINQGFSGVNATVTNGFAGVNNAICTLGYQNAQLINGLSRELGDCLTSSKKSILKKVA